MQRIGDERGGEHLLDGDHVAQERVRVVLGVQRRGDLDLGQLRAGRAELVHVPAGGECVVPGHRRAPQVLELALRRRAERRPAARRHAAVAGQAGERDQRDVGLPGDDRRHRRARGARGTTTRRSRSSRTSGSCSPRYSHIEIGAEAGGVAGAVVGVDVGERQAGVGQRPGGDLGVDLRQRAVGDLAQRVLVRPGDERLAPPRHVSLRSIAGTSAPRTPAMARSRRPDATGRRRVIARSRVAPLRRRTGGRTTPWQSPRSSSPPERAPGCARPARSRCTSICGRPMVMHVIHALADLDVERTVVVVGHGAERVTKKVQEQAPTWAKRQLRRADRAARHRRRHARRAHRVPRRRPRRHLHGRRAARRHPAAAAETLDALVTEHLVNEHAATVLTTELDDPTGYGRIVRAPSKAGEGRVLRIVEQRDATFEEREIREVNTVDVRLPPRPARPGAAPRHPGQRPGRVLPHRRDRLAGGDGPPDRLRARPPPRRPRASTTAGSWPSPSASCAAARTATG